MKIDEIDEFGKGILHGGLAKIYGLEQKPQESDKEFASRLEAASRQRAIHSQECALRYMSEQEAKAKDYGCTCGATNAL